MFTGISWWSSIFLFPVLAGFTGKYQTSNLGVGGSNPSERANKSGHFFQRLWRSGTRSQKVLGRAGDADSSSNAPAATPMAARAYSRRQLLANAAIAASRVGS